MDNLADAKNKTTHWDGVRNYQARNFMRDDMKIGDLVLYYHSNTEPPSAVGLCEVVKEAYPDFTAFDDTEDHYDPKSDPKNPRWFMMDIKLIKKFKNIVTLADMKNNPKLSEMKLVQRGNRLSVMPVTIKELNEVVKMSGTKL
ncbi:MAG: EVE domain-containing protein [Ignavibacteriae bacterium]|nr:EVE domain-containing protein [Ignavibacteriota bacterium]